jgi:hypothetical protein
VAQDAGGDGPAGGGRRRPGPVWCCCFLGAGWFEGRRAACASAASAAASRLPPRAGQPTPLHPCQNVLVGSRLLRHGHRRVAPVWPRHGTGFSCAVFFFVTRRRAQRDCETQLAFAHSHPLSSGPGVSAHAKKHKNPRTALTSVSHASPHTNVDPRPPRRRAGRRRRARQEYGHQAAQGCVCAREPIDQRLPFVSSPACPRSERPGLPRTARRRRTPHPQPAAEGEAVRARVLTFPPLHTHTHTHSQAGPAAELRGRHLGPPVGRGAGHPRQAARQLLAGRPVPGEWGRV